MERRFNAEYKKDFMKMQKGEDWNKLKEKYGDISKFKWDEDMNKHFNWFLGQYSDYETRKK